MGAYNPGGGGGRASGTDTEDQFAYDQPHEISNTFTAETAQQINDMFAILFKAVSRAQTNIAAITTTTSDILVAHLTLTSAQLDTLNASPVEIIPAPGELKTIVPLNWSIRVDKNTAWTANAVFRLQYNGSTAVICTSRTSGLTSGAPTVGNNFLTGDHTEHATTFPFGSGGDTVENKAVEVTFVADTNPGANDNTVANISVAYYIKVRS